MGSSREFDAELLWPAADRDRCLKLKLIGVYESQSRVFLAMERGEVDGYPSVFYSALTSPRPTWCPRRR